jgi:hypothetical protein
MAGLSGGRWRCAACAGLCRFKPPALSQDEEKAQDSVAMVLPDLGRKLRPAAHSDPETRVKAGRHRQQLAGLKKLERLAAALAPGLTTVAEYVRRRGLDEAAKNASFKGFDWVPHRYVDYGNVVYKAVLHGFALEQPRVHAALNRVAQDRMPTMEVGYDDTYDSLSNQGDVIEIIMGVARGDNFDDTRRDHTTEEWRQIYEELIQLCRSLAYLRCLLHGGCLKHNHQRVCRIIRADCPGTSAFLMRVARELRELL